jgi:hypothetical protein
MKEALTFVKKGLYKEAIELYDQIVEDYKSPAAKANANMLRQSIESEIAAKAELAELFNDKDGLAEKASKAALAALTAKLPADTNITIMKTSSTERSMLDYVVDKLTKDLLAGGIKIVDRSNQALIDAEQQFQLSGNVSDESSVSIGKQLGVQYMVLCGISGEKSLRRLNVKVLNVETAQIADQADFEI